jgi:hypothetical protein
MEQKPIFRPYGNMVSVLFTGGHLPGNFFRALNMAVFGKTRS